MQSPKERVREREKMKRSKRKNIKAYLQENIHEFLRGVCFGRKQWEKIDERSVFIRDWITNERCPAVHVLPHDGENFFIQGKGLPTRCRDRLKKKKKKKHQCTAQLNFF